MHYSGALGAGAALRYTPTLTGFKEDIILSSYQGENEFFLCAEDKRTASGRDRRELVFNR